MPESNENQMKKIKKKCPEEEGTEKDCLFVVHS